jgi:hypothetical protein
LIRTTRGLKIAANLLMHEQVERPPVRSSVDGKAGSNLSALAA